MKGCSMKISDYKNEIAKATTKDELSKISYKAFLQDDAALKGKRSLYNLVITACIKREQELGLL